MFAKVVEERSFAGASKDMGVSVATVSRAVTRLEERLGWRLLNRTSRRLALTDYGRALAERASKRVLRFSVEACVRAHADAYRSVAGAREPAGVALT